MTELVPSSRVALDATGASKLARALFGAGAYCYRAKGDRVSDGFRGARYYVAHALRGQEQALAYGRSYEEALSRAVWYWSPKWWGKEYAWRRT